MSNSTTVRPAQGQLIVSIDDISMMRDIKKAISMLRGVGKVTVPRRKRLTGYEEAMRDLEQGRVYDYDTFEDLLKEIAHHKQIQERPQALQKAWVANRFASKRSQHPAAR